MNITGELLIGGAAVRGAETAYRGLDPATGLELEPSFGGAGPADLDRACALAAAAFDAYRETELEERARLLETIARCILDIGDPLIERASSESGLPRGRIEGERGRTIGQLRLFAEVVREGGFLDVRMRPICYQDFPAALLPDALHDEASNMPRRIDGQLVPALH